MRKANLGYATTRELLEELKSRGETAHLQDPKWGPDGDVLVAVSNAVLNTTLRQVLDYRTVDDV